MGRAFEARKHTMFARWDRMSKAFARCGKDIHIAVKSGGESPDINPSLRRAIQNARAVNMPKDKIEAAIKRGASKDTADLQECIYEGYAPHGVAVMVVAATDNPTRTIANVRVCFNKGDGSLGNAGSVGFCFDRMGTFRLKPEGIEREELELDLIDHGLEALDDGSGEKGEPLLVVRCLLGDFGRMQEALEKRSLDVLSSGSEFVPQSVVHVSDAQEEDVLKLIDRLEQDEDIQEVFHNLA